MSRLGILPFIFAGLLLILPGGCSKDSSTTGQNGGDSDSESGAEDSSGDTTSDSESGATDSDTESDDTDSCVSDIVDCTIKCGRIADNCSDETYDCGGCDVGFVCDIVTNNCVEPLVSCENLEAECGAIKNSCGVRLNCGYCATDQECDADSNECVKCSEPTCADLGYECGPAWNGCGSRSDAQNQLDCGECNQGMVCNDNYNICEPDCEPATLEEICADVECGKVSDGCGSMVDCGSDCPEGTQCGARGVANICSTPERALECEVAGWECGEYTSACNDDPLDCGSCEAPDICNTNHKCGPPCESLTCETGYAGQCGQQLDDGCEGNIDCNCDNGLTCDSVAPGQTGECKPLATCFDYTNGEDDASCSNGASPDFPRGDEVNLTCNCVGGRDCIDNDGNLVTGETTGSCCSNTESCNAGDCTYTNSCTGEEVYCCNNATQFCNNSTGKCQDRRTCSEIDWVGFPKTADGTVGAPCSNAGNEIFPDGSGDSLSCPCNAGLICVGGDGTTPGSCCQNENTCDDAFLMDDNCQIPNSCTGGPALDCCAWNECCEPGAVGGDDSSCVMRRECDYYQNDPTEIGDACSTNRFFERCSATSSDNATVRCGCDGAAQCCLQTDQDQEGECVANPQCANTTDCTVTNPCTGEETNCCGSDEYCGSDNQCHQEATCGDYSADGALGDNCSDAANTNFPLGDGSNLACPCNDSGGWFNMTCNGDSATVEGECQCTPRSCTCANSGSSDGCGGNVGNCACTNGDVCDTSGTPTCCTPYQCPTTAGGECDISHDSCGSTVTCGCPDQYETCGGKGEDNVCGCDPIDPCGSQTGWVVDNCGNDVNCGG